MIKQLIFRLLFRKEIKDMLEARYKATRDLETLMPSHPYLAGYSMGTKGTIERIINKLSGSNL